MDSESRDRVWRSRELQWARGNLEGPDARGTGTPKGRGMQKHEEETYWLRNFQTGWKLDPQIQNTQWTTNTRNTRKTPRNVITESFKASSKEKIPRADKATPQGETKISMMAACVSGTGMRHASSKHGKENVNWTFLSSKEHFWN